MAAAAAAIVAISVVLVCVILEPLASDEMVVVTWAA
jgi:hypothetical protein